MAAPFWCLALVAVAATAGDATVPEVTEMDGAQKILFSFQAGGESRPSFTAKEAGGAEQQATRELPSDGIKDYKLALVAKTDKEGAITGFAFVTWKPAERKAENEWPQLKPIEGAEARIRGAATLLIRQLPAEGKDPKWSFEIISFRRIEPKEADDPVVRAKKEILEEGGARLIEDKRFTLVAPAMPTERTCYGILLVPVWKDPGKTLDGFDAQLVTTPAPATKPE